jgi:hypothetical protein
MLRKMRWTWLTALVAGGLGAGCGLTSSRPFPPDPLLLSKRPVEGKVEATAPRQFAFNPPDPPAVPDPAATARQTPAPVEPRAVPAVPASRAKDPAASPASQPAQTPSGVYGHAEDYSWLKGVLIRHPNGSVDLRYCDIAAEDRWGGKVCLEPDSRLNAVRDGQVIYVEGSLVPETDETPLTTWNSYPTYHIRVLRTVPDGK